MPTDKQIAANRANAQNSTGPTTPQGKLASSQNSLKSGIYSKALIIRGESQDALDALIAEFLELYQPTAPDERSLVDTLIANEWLLRRLRNTEAQLWERSMASDASRGEYNPETALGAVHLRYESSLTNLQRRITTLERSIHRALRDLVFLQKSRSPVQPADSKPSSPKLASFPQNSARVPQTTEPSPLSPDSLTPDAAKLKPDA